MRLFVPAAVLAIGLGYALGGRLSHLAALRLRWPALAMLGLALQLVTGPGDVVPVVALYLSFALLVAFAVANIRTPGFVLVLVGVLLNLAVIAMNDGMPVSRSALVASGQAGTIDELASGETVKHHLSGPGDDLVFLGDVIAVPALEQVISVGDVFVYGGFVLVVALGMRRRAVPVPRSGLALPEGVPDGA
jgi:hypothetical protein